MKQIKYLILAFAPLALGFIMLQIPLAPNFFSLLFYFAWYFVGYSSGKDFDTPAASFLFGNFLSVLLFFLGSTQLLRHGTYASNLFGLLPQLFFAPANPISAKVMLSIIQTSPAFACLCLSFLLTSMVYILGYYRKRSEK